LLSDKDLENSIVIRTYPSLRAHLALEKRFESSKGELKLYRFESGVPWQEYFASFSQHESYSQGLIRDIDRFRSWYLSVSKPELGQHRQTP
jgi:hypothetical protein